MRVGVLLAAMSGFPYSTFHTSRAFSRVGNNTGNLLFIEATKRLVVDPVPVSFDTPVAQLRELDVIVVPAANWYGPRSTIAEHAGNLIEAGVPTLMLGLGAQAELGAREVGPTPAMARWLAAIAETRSANVPNILVRGQFTADALAAIGIESSVLGCPSLFLNSEPDLGHVIAAKRARGTSQTRMCVISGLHNYTHLAQVDAQLTHIARASEIGLPWILQEGPELMTFARDSVTDHDRAVAAVAGRHFAPDLTSEQFETMLRDRAVAFFAVDPWVDHMKRFDMVVGPRFHGIMAAVAAGTPGVLVAHDSRTKELAEACGLPHVTHGDPVDAPSLIAAFDAQFDAAAFDAVRTANAAVLNRALNALRIPHYQLLKAEGARLPL